MSNAALSAVLIQTVNASRMRILAYSGDMFKAANGSVSLHASIPSDSYVNSRVTAERPATVQARASDLERSNGTLSRE